MSRFLIFLFALLTAALVTGGCSSSNSDAPNVDEAHPSGWISEHPGEARERLADCTLCHGASFQGAGDVVSCFAPGNAAPNGGCHFSAPPVEPRADEFLVHPAEWDNVVEDHQEFARLTAQSPAGNSWTTCANGACHGTDLRGGVRGPSCFTASCHADGPPAPESHVEFFFQPQNHGPLAQDNQLYCRNCHGRPLNTFDGGFVADPNITDEAIGNCSLSFCHPAATAHPTNWQGSNDLDAVYLASHRDINPAAIGTSCALCHRTDAEGPGPLAAAPSCFASSFTNADGSSTACHPGGPGNPPHPVGDEWLLPGGHVFAAQQNPQPCAGCHVSGGVPPSCAECHVNGDPTMVQTGCVSCHGAPPNGDTRPNRAGRHTIPGHQGGLFSDCQNCHFGAGSGSLMHFDRVEDGATDAIASAEVNLNTAHPLFNFTYDRSTPAPTCSNVLCHQPADAVRSWYP